MIITVKTGQAFDTNTDLSAPERHILQKLFAWEAMALSVEQFKEKKNEALLKGWNDSGPVKGGTAFHIIARDMERKVKTRLASNGKGVNGC